MRRAVRVGAISAIAILCAGCGAGEPETFEVSGTISLLVVGTGMSTYNPDSAGDDPSNPSGAEVGSRCSGGDAVPGFNEGDEVVIEDAEGTRVAVGELPDGTLPEGFDSAADIGITTCLMDFTVEDVPAGDGIFVARIGDEEVSFKQSEAGDLEFSVSNDG